MNIRLMAGLLISLVIVVAAYIFMQPKEVTPGTSFPKTGMQIDQQIDSVINQEMDKTLANVNQADVEQLLLS